MQQLNFLTPKRPSKNKTPSQRNSFETENLFNILQDAQNIKDDGNVNEHDKYVTQRSRKNNKNKNKVIKDDTSRNSSPNQNKSCLYTWSLCIKRSGKATNFLRLILEL